MSELALKIIAENKKTKNTFLDLGNCGLTELPDELFKCNWIKKLNFDSSYYDLESRKYIKSPNKGKSNKINGNTLYKLGKLTELQSLDICSNQITDISFLEKLPGLQSLYLSSNQIADISFLEKLPCLQSLYLNSNQITDISFLEKLPGLQSLDLRANKITDISILEKLPGLQSLDLGWNQITDIRFLEKLPGLQSLDLRSNQITEISFLAKLPGLQSLDLNSNKITDISFLEKLTGLQNLDLSTNQITDISFLEKLTGLQSLDLSTNQITDISFLEKLTGLQSLDLSTNQITDVSFLEKLTYLQSLDLRSNKITDIRFLEKLPGLQSLDLRSNQITDIRFLEKLTGLQSLYLSSNQITDITPILPLIQKGIPINLVEFGIQNTIGLGNNSITRPPMHIVEQGNEAVIRYFDEGEGPLTPLNECKLIFVGDGKVGKTCLMKRIVYDKFDPNEKQTHGINKIAWKKIRTKEKKLVRVNLWDFGGQDIQHSLHQFFFSERVIYVLVLTPRNDEKAAYWLEQIDKLGANSDVLIVYNWHDKKEKEAPFLQKFYELRKKYNKLQDPFVLSVKTNEGIKEFKEGLKKAILRNEGLVHTYPQKWFLLKKKLEAKVSVGQNYIDFKTYEKWCEKIGYNNEDSQRELLVILNSIGAIVFFNRPILNQLQVLNPEWITTGAYAVITSNITSEKKGHLAFDDLKKIFRSGKEIFSDKKVKIRYNEGQFHFIIQLMVEYDLCQENHLKKGEYLIPSAFGDKPAKDYESHKSGSREYRIQFDSPFEMLIIHRFIARNLSKVIGKDYWQSGILIKDSKSDTSALVETNKHFNRIDLWIKGDNIRGFWESISRDFYEICGFYKNFSFKEEVLYKKEKNKVFLPYQEMLDSLRNGVKTINYHPTYKLFNIDVLEILDMFEDIRETENKLNMGKNSEERILKVEFNSYTENNLHIKNRIDVKVELLPKQDLEFIKSVLLDLKTAASENKEWQTTLIKCLDEFKCMEEAEDRATQNKSITAIEGCFNKLKNIKDVVEVLSLPVTVSDNIPKLLALWETAKAAFQL